MLPIEKYNVNRISVSVAKELITLHHYSHSWTTCKHAIGLLKDDCVVGVAVYGNPVGRLAAQSISPFVKENEVLELTRLWVADSEGKNSESWFLGKTFDWIKKHDNQIRVLLSYTDPSQGHKGTIYQATNWLYQGDVRGTEYFLYKIGNKHMHPRTAFSTYGTNDIVELKKIIPNIETIILEQKLRYIYILDKKNRNHIISTLKHPIKKYDKFIVEKNPMLNQTVPHNQQKTKNTFWD